MIKAPRGTRDLLPPETELWNFVEQTCRDLFRSYNFQEIRTPVFEDLELFRRSVGEETDIVGKEMFAWEDAARGRTDELKQALLDPFVQEVARRSRENVVKFGEWLRSLPEDQRIRAWAMVIPSSKGQMLALRPENTAGVVRAYIENKMWESGTLQKLYYMGPQFRRERPQKGRYRQFCQIGAEVIGPPASGSESPTRDAEVLQMLAALLDRLGIRDWTLELNSVGCPNDRPRYDQALRQALAGVVAKMCGDCQRRAQSNPLRVFDCKVTADQEIIRNLPRLSDYLDEPCRQHFAAVQELLGAVAVPFTLNDRLVRGIDYYQKTAFEFTHGALGAQNAILGGGRYDGLSETLGGPRAPGIGFAIGEDRLVLALAESKGVAATAVDAYIAPLGEGMNREAAKLARELRRAGLVIELGDETFRLKKSLETAAKMGARYAVIVGENEVKSGEFAVKDLSKGEQVSMPRAELARKLAP